MNNTIKRLHPQAELTDRDIALLSRKARQFAGNPKGAEVFIRPETYQEVTAQGQPAQKIRLVVHLEYQETGSYPGRIEFLAVRCSNCGRLILHYPDADAVCPYKGCDRFAARFRQISTFA